MLDRNFRSCCIIIFCAYGVLYANTTSLPALLQTLFGYDATTSGLVLSPAGLFAIIVLLIVGILALARRRCALSHGRRIGDDGRRQLLDVAIESDDQPVAGGLAAGGIDCRPFDAVCPAERRGVLVYPARNCEASAVGLLALLRNEGGSVGTSVAQTVLERREQFHTLRLNESLDPFNPAVTQLMTQGQAFFLRQSGDSPLADQQTLQTLYQLRGQQALSLSYFDVFWSLSAVAFGMVLLILLMRRSVAEKGTHVGAE